MATLTYEYKVRDHAGAVKSGTIGKLLDVLDMTERVRDKVREEPLTAIAITAGVAYLFGLLSRR